eukprot:1265286-Rhodomonas_salina.3
MRCILTLLSCGAIRHRQFWNGAARQAQEGWAGICHEDALEAAGAQDPAAGAHQERTGGPCAVQSPVHRQLVSFPPTIHFRNQSRSTRDEMYLYLCLEYSIGGEFFSHLRKAQ